MQTFSKLSAILDKLAGDKAELQAKLETSAAMVPFLLSGKVA